jgi:hypothetical protein
MESFNSLLGLIPFKLALLVGILGTIPFFLSLFGKMPKKPVSYLVFTLAMIVGAMGAMSAFMQILFSGAGSAFGI